MPHILPTVIVCVLFCLFVAEGRRARFSTAQFSPACFGSIGLKQTANVLECHVHISIPRICIQNVVYGTKRTSSGDSECPYTGISSPVSPDCCTSARGDCYVKANDTKKLQLQAVCSGQSLSRCIIQADQIVSNVFIACTGSSATSIFRAIDYICITDNDQFAKLKGCYTPRVAPTPALVSTGVTEKRHVSNFRTSSPTSFMTESSFQLPITDIPPGIVTKPNRNNPNIHNTKPPGSDRVVESSTGLDGEEKSTDSNESNQDEKVIIAVSVSVVGIVVVVISVLAVRTFYRRRQMKKKNKWVENNLNKERLNNTNDVNSTVVEEGLSENHDQRVQGETTEEYAEVNEGLIDPDQARSVKKTPSRRDGTNDRTLSDNDNRNAGGEPMMQLKSIGNHKYQEVGLSRNNPLYKSAGYAPPPYSKNLTSEEKMKKIVDKITNTDELNVFKRGSKYGKSGRDGYNSDTATLRRVAMFVKKCIREIDISDHPRASRSKRNRRSSASEIPTLAHHDKVRDKRNRKHKNIVVKPWDFIRGSKNKTHHTKKKVKPRKSSLKKENVDENMFTYNDFGRNEDYSEAETSDHALNSSEEDAVCRFPIRRHSVMKRKRRKSGDSDSIPSTSESVRSSPRNLEVRFHKKLTYIDSDRRVKKSQSVRSRSRSKKRDQEFDDGDELPEAVHRRSSGTREGKHRRDSLDLKDLRTSRRKANRSRTRKQDSVSRNDVKTRKSSLRKSKDDEFKDEVSHRPRRHSAPKRSRPHTMSTRASSRRKSKPHIAPKSRKKRTTKSDISRRKRPTDEQDRDYVTETNDTTDSDSSAEDH